MMVKHSEISSPGIGCHPCSGQQSQVDGGTWPRRVRLLHSASFGIGIKPSCLTGQTTLTIAKTMVKS